MGIWICNPYESYRLTIHRNEGEEKNEWCMKKEKEEEVSNDGFRI